MPMIGHIYYPNSERIYHPNSTPVRGVVPKEYAVAINIATLGGSILGQLGFGLAGDWLGRRKAYGLELMITVAAALGSAMASNGINGSMSLIGWLIFWRLIMGIGIGADYPLSAVLCSEMAPTRLRGRMLTAVFMCQPLGQLLATLVPLVAVYAARESLPHDSQVCEGDCLKTLDVIWRLILGLGAVPAAASLWFRLTIIESPRYTVDIVRNDHQAAVDVNRYFYSGDHFSTRSRVSFQQDHEDELNTEEAHNPIFPLSTIDSEEVQQPPQASWADIKDYFWHQGNYRTLVATSLTWLSLDLAFYGLGMNDYTTLEIIWANNDGNPPDTPSPLYQSLLANAWQSLLIVSLGAILGNLITLVSINRLGRRVIQINGFFWLFVLFLVIGTSYHTLTKTYRSPVIVVLYILTQIFFNFGPNTTTYIIPAEMFPTRYRATAHGISAAFGKLGAVLSQCILGWLQGSIQTDKTYLLVFSAFMLIGLVLTVYWIPRSRDKNGRTFTLEELALGRQASTSRCTIAKHSTTSKAVDVRRRAGSVDRSITVPFDAGQEGAAIGVEEGVTTVDEALELDTTDELEVDGPTEEVPAELDTTDELELDELDEEVAAELEGIVDVLKEVMDGVVLELEALELLETDVEAVLVDEVTLALVAAELEVVLVVVYPSAPTEGNTLDDDDDDDDEATEVLLTEIRDDDVDVDDVDDVDDDVDVDDDEGEEEEEEEEEDEDEEKDEDDAEEAREESADDVEDAVEDADEGEAMPINLAPNIPLLVTAAPSVFLR
ncbi:MFS general substrate transporter, partial [Aureobasidium melanogenum]